MSHKIMKRPESKYAILLTLLLCICGTRATAETPRWPEGKFALSTDVAAEHFVDRQFSAIHAISRLAADAWRFTLPPEPKPTTHWPWWLRILAVIGVLVFIRLVAGSVRSKPSGPSPS
jgi:hypothetical protein